MWKGVFPRVKKKWQYAPTDILVRNVQQYRPTFASRFMRSPKVNCHVMLTSVSSSAVRNYELRNGSNCQSKKRRGRWTFSSLLLFFIGSNPLFQFWHTQFSFLCSHIRFNDDFETSNQYYTHFPPLYRFFQSKMKPLKKLDISILKLRHLKFCHFAASINFHDPFPCNLDITNILV